jgi:FlaA1/EpsC-like NDP-sugar epimerase
MAFRYNQVGAVKTIEPDARALAAAVHDGIALCLAFVAASVLLEVDGVGYLESRELFLSFAIAVPIQVAINYLFGIYQGIWRYTSLPDIQRIVFAVLCGSVAIAISLQLFGIDNHFGYREYILYPLFLVSLMSL